METFKFKAQKDYFTLFLQVANVIAYLFMIIMNIIANTYKFNGLTSGDVSDKYPTRFTPAGYTFSIWGVIYTWLGLFAIFQALPMNHDGNGFVRNINIFFIVNAIANGWWSYAFAYEVFWLSIILILTLLFTLIAIYVLIPIQPRMTAKQRKQPDLGLNTKYFLELLLVHVPFSLYAGWALVATVANFFVLIAASPFNYTTWNEGYAIIMSSVIAVIAFFMLFFYLDVVFGVVITWALIGVAVAQSDYEYICFTSAFLAGFIGISSIITELYRAYVNWYLPLHGYQRLLNRDSGSSLALRQ